MSLVSFSDHIQTPNLSQFSQMNFISLLAVEFPAESLHIWASEGLPLSGTPPPLGGRFISSPPPLLQLCKLIKPPIGAVQPAAEVSPIVLQPGNLLVWTTCDLSVQLPDEV